MATLLVAEVAERLRVSRDKILGWIRSGELRAVNVGDGSKKPHWRIDEADLAAFEQRRSGGATNRPSESQRQRRVARVVEAIRKTHGIGDRT